MTMHSKSLHALCALAALSSPVWADENGATDRLKQQLQEVSHGRIQPDAITKTPVPGVFEVRAGLDLIYVDGTGRYAFVEGHLLDLKENKDLTQQKLDNLARIDFKSLPFDLALKTVRGNGRRQLAVFEDPTCPYCRALHTLLDQLDDVTIYTFPFPVLSPDSDAKARAALCAPDRAKAWKELMMQGKVPAAQACATQVDRILQLGTQLNIRGTPTVFFADGRRSQGAVPPDQFMALLTQAQP